MTTAPDLDVWQAQLDDLTFGIGTPYEITAMEGLGDLPDLRTDDSDRPGAHGQFPGVDLASGRTVTVDLEVMADATAGITYADALAALRRTAVVTEDDVLVPFWFRTLELPTLRLDVKVRRRSIPTTAQAEMGLAAAALQLRAPDPRAYGPTKAATTFLPAPGGGLTYPLTYPLSYGTPANLGRVSMDNAGNAKAWAVHTVYGPHDAGFELVDIATGRRIRYSSPVSASSWIVIDTRTGKAMEQGTADRSLSLAQWTPIPAGGSTVVQLNTYGVRNAAARLDSTWADTYWL